MWIWTSGAFHSGKLERGGHANHRARGRLERIQGSRKNWTRRIKKWAERFYSAAERAAGGRPPVHYRYYAGRFAGKEAVVKALGTGFAGEITWRGIEILRRESGMPVCPIERRGTSVGRESRHHRLVDKY